jgi:hypothetical protein
MADFFAFEGALPSAMIVLASGLCCQSLLASTKLPLPPRNSRQGSARTPVTPNCVRVGPSARTTTGFGALPPTMSPPIKILSPVPTYPRVETLPRRRRVTANVPLPKLLPKILLSNMTDISSSPSIAVTGEFFTQENWRCARAGSKS